MFSRRCVITGVGVVSAIGHDAASFWRALVSGKSGVAPVERYDVSDFPVRFAAEVKDFDPLRAMDRKEVRRSDRYTQYAMAAALEAVEDADLDLSGVDPYRVGVIIGSGVGGIETFELQFERQIGRGPGAVSPFSIPMMIANMAGGQVAIRLGAKGLNYAPVSACASGGHALGEAMNAVRNGVLDVVIAGGSEAAVSRFSLAAFAKMGALSRRNDAPERASRPFDAGRDGFVLGEGAGIVVLEERERAVERGARIYAELAGYGATADAFHITMPSPDGEAPARAMTDAMAQAGLGPADVDYINAHGTSTPLNDRMETAAIHAAFGDEAGRLMVSSTKSMTGHLLGAAAGLELVATALAIHHGIVPPTINYEERDPDCDLDYVPNEARKARVRAALSNSLGFGGHNVSLALREPS